MNICEATPVDLKTVIAWILDAEMCRAWAGPMVRFPLNLEGIAQDIEFELDNSYCLVEDQNITAFGQLIRKNEKRLHMARIIVAPDKRASGIGRQWCLALMALARQKGCHCISLNVYRDNLAALRIYTRTGFSEDVENSTPELCYMIAHGKADVKKERPHC